MLSQINKVYIIFLREIMNVHSIYQLTSSTTATLNAHGIDEYQENYLKRQERNTYRVIKSMRNRAKHRH